MARKIKITEEQYKMLMKEDVRLQADVAAAGGDVNKAVQTTKQQAQKDNVNLEKATIEVPASTVESKMISIKELRENRKKVLKENSKCYSLNDFIKSIK